MSLLVLLRNVRVFNHAKMSVLDKLTVLKVLFSNTAYLFIQLNLYSH